ncbi:hypothetical protein QVA66_03770 [Staphylococcus chromogenes]|nr:hypothetical protein [Staphylococcus chromogenes]
MKWPLLGFESLTWHCLHTAGVKEKERCMQYGVKPTEKSSIKWQVIAVSAYIASMFILAGLLMVTIETF